MDRCEICTWPGEIRVYVRPLAGGPRTAHFFCCEECKESGLRVLRAEGLAETHGVLGWDVFKPAWERE